MPKLVILGGNRAGETVEVAKDEFTVGRDPGCELRIEDGTVSRRHAVLVRDRAGWQIRDLGSRNGIRVQGNKVPSARIASGDLLHVGSVQMRFVEEAVPAAAEGGAAAPLPAKGPLREAAALAPRRSMDLPAVLLGVGIVAALAILLFAFREDRSVRAEVVVLRVEEERYFSLETEIHSVGSPTRPGIVEVSGAKPGASSLVLTGLSEGETDLPLDTESGAMVLGIRVERRLPPAAITLTAAEADEEARRLLAEGRAAEAEEALMLVALQRYDRILEIGGAVRLDPTLWGEAEDGRRRAKRRLSDLREACSSPRSRTTRAATATRRSGSSTSSTPRRAPWTTSAGPSASRRSASLPRRSPPISSASARAKAPPRSSSRRMGAPHHIAGRLGSVVRRSVSWLRSLVLATHSRSLSFSFPPIPPLRVGYLCSVAGRETPGWRAFASSLRRGPALQSPVPAPADRDAASRAEGASPGPLREVGANCLGR